MQADTGHVVKSPKWKSNMSVRISSCPLVRGPFTIFVFVFNSFNTRYDYYYYSYEKCGGSSVAMHFPPKWGLEDPSGTSRAYMYVSMSLCLSFLLSVSLSGRPHCSLVIIKARLVVALRAYGRRPWGQIP